MCTGVMDSITQNENSSCSDEAKNMDSSGIGSDDGTELSQSIDGSHWSRNDQCIPGPHA